MKINNDNGLTIIMGYEKTKLLEKTYDILTEGAVNQYTYYFDRFNTNLVDVVYYHMKNQLNNIIDETKKRVVKGDNQPVVVLMTNSNGASKLSIFRLCRELPIHIKKKLIKHNFFLFC